MAAALAASASLRAAAERAVAVRRVLRASAPEPIPAGMRRRLLAIPGGRKNVWRPFALPIAASLVAAVATVVWLRPEPAPQVDPRVAAVAQELEVAMRYLHKSARITQDQVTNAVGSGFRDAVAVTRGAVGQETDETGG
jgi:hypothetical protein